jgi:hypothetical protein
VTLPMQMWTVEEVPAMQHATTAGDAAEPGGSMYHTGTLFSGKLKTL